MLVVDKHYFHLNRKFDFCFDAILFNYRRQRQQLQHQPAVGRERERERRADRSDSSAGGSLGGARRALGQALADSVQAEGISGEPRKSSELRQSAVHRTAHAGR